MLARLTNDAVRQWEFFAIFGTQNDIAVRSCIAFVNLPTLDITSVGKTLPVYLKISSCSFEIGF